MNTKKIILPLTFIAAFGYSLYDLSLKASSFWVDYSTNKSVSNLDKTIHLYSENGLVQFQRVNSNKFCSSNTCGYVKNLNQDRFDFYWEKHDILKFKQSPNEKNVFLLDTENSSKNKDQPLLKISFHSSTLFQQI